MFENLEKRMGEAGSRVAESDSETLWAMIQAEAKDHPLGLASAVLAISQMENWTPTHTALALAYSHMILTKGFKEDMQEIVQSFSPRSE